MNEIKQSRQKPKDDPSQNLKVASTKPLNKMKKYEPQKWAKIYTEQVSLESTIDGPKTSRRLR